MLTPVVTASQIFVERSFGFCFTPRSVVVTFRPLLAWSQCCQFTPQQALQFPRAANDSKIPGFRRNDVNADFTAEELAFQEEVREFLQNEFPADLKAKVDASVRLDKDDMVRWQKILFKKAGQHLPGR